MSNFGTFGKGRLMSTYVFAMPGYAMQTSPEQASTSSSMTFQNHKTWEVPSALLEPLTHTKSGADGLRDCASHGVATLCKQSSREGSVRYPLRKPWNPDVSKQTSHVQTAPA